MPPNPIDDIEYPDISGRIADLLCALWTVVYDVCLIFWYCIYTLWMFVCDICNGIWYCATQVFMAVWPYFEGFWNDFYDGLTGLGTYVYSHPITALAIFFFLFGLVPGVLSALLICLTGESEERDRLRAFYAANYQSTIYGPGGNVPRYSTSARSGSQAPKAGGNRHRG